MTSPVIQEFAVSLPADAGLLRAEVTAGVPIDRAEVLSLAAAIQALFVSATLESRDLGSVDKCRALWGEVSELFNELCGTWAQIDSDDPEIRWLRGRLGHFQELAEDRCDLYKISTAERVTHSKIRGDLEVETSFTQRGGGKEPRIEGEHSTPAHVYQIGHF